MATIKLKNITEEQLEGIQIFININEWDNIEIEREPDQTAVTDHVQRTQTSPVPSNSGAIVNEEVLFCDILQDTTCVNCPFCFLQPCITTHRQSWLVGRKVPHRGNCATRKRMYKMFWSAMSHHHAWRHPLYIQKKREHLTASFPDTVWETVSAGNREIMPKCVLELVRGLYPNPPGQAYMEHQW
jgi:hypothetical protein